MSTKADRTAKMLQNDHDFLVEDAVWWAGDPSGIKGRVTRVERRRVWVLWTDPNYPHELYYTLDMPDNFAHLRHEQ